ncbi:MAG: alpha-ketoglutarate-dependent dioxygenase AlkB [Lysobacteraceae bacterium]
MDFESIPLPGAELRLYRAFLTAESADATMAALLDEVAWTQRSIRIYGREVLQPRLLCWVGDPEARYRYSGGDYEPEPWTPTLSGIRERIESVTGSCFNSVLCNRYRDGDDAMGWHSDDEPELGAQPAIASLSLGVTRAMKFRPRKGFAEGRAGELPLAHGDLLVMAGDTQRYYQHAIARSRRITAERINLTFRRVMPKT